jgi:hypothetical protein
MTEELTTPSFCEVFGIDVSPNTTLKIFGKLFCSVGIIYYFITSKQVSLAYEEFEKTLEVLDKREKSMMA